VIENLTKLVDSGKLSEADTAAVKEMINVVELTGKMEEALKVYFGDATDENAKAYEKQRVAAFEAMSKFIGLK
jgi:hypothetical protein